MDARILGAPVTARGFRLALAAILLAGLGLRIAAAQGGLWLDEAWSAYFARETGTILGVFVQLNHDNNHHLNTIWLQLVGEHAAPVVQRGLAILTGTATIAVAAAIGARRNMIVALVAAALFAVSPILVTYGSEARGYAPMLLALVGAILLVDRWLAAPETPPPALGLALAALFGMLAQLSFAFGLVALAGWAAIDLARREAPAGALWRTARLLGPAIIVAIVFAAVTILPARASPTGFRFGAFDPFTIGNYSNALATLVVHSLGLPLWLAAVGIACLLLAGGRGLLRSPLLPFHALAILAFPLAVALLQLPNSGFPRYYLLVALGLLLLTAELAAHGVSIGGWRRGLAGLALAGLIAGGLIADVHLIAGRRGDPGAALDAIAARAPAGAAVLIEQPRATAVLDVAARRRVYRLTIVTAPCPGPRFLYLDRDGHAPFPDRPVHCGVGYRAVSGGTSTDLHSLSWRLYEREP